MIPIDYNYLYVPVKAKLLVKLRKLHKKPGCKKGMALLKMTSLGKDIKGDGQTMAVMV